jgi:hypothetical protein
VKPRSHRRGHGLEVRLETVVSRHLHHLASRTGRRHPEPIALALDDHRWHLHCIKLGHATLQWRASPVRRLEGEGEAEPRNGSGRLRGAAGDARA